MTVEERLRFLLGVQHLLRRTDNVVQKIQCNRTRMEDQWELPFLQSLKALADHFPMDWDCLIPELWHVRFAVKPSLEFSQMLCEAMQ
jgi:hypothetical protein